MGELALELEKKTWLWGWRGLCLAGKRGRLERTEEEDGGPAVMVVGRRIVAI